MLIQSESMDQFTRVLQMCICTIVQIPAKKQSRPRYYALVEHMLIRVGDDECSEELAGYRVSRNYRMSRSLILNIKFKLNFCYNKIKSF